MFWGTLPPLAPAESMKHLSRIDRGRTGPAAVLRVMVLAVALTSIGLLSGCTEQSSEETAASNFDQPSQTFPGNGVSQTLAGDCVVTGVGQLTISVPAGEESYFAKLVNRDPGAFTLGVTVSAGQTATIDVPVCDSFVDDYDLTYAAGTTWYGYDYTFGPDGAYASAAEVFPFEDGTQWEVELILQVGGNLGTSGMDYGDF